VSIESNAPPEVVDLTVPQPQAAEIYYNSCAMIDMHNRCRPDDLQLEHNEKSLTGWRQVNLVVGMCVVDAYLVFKSASPNESITQRYFYIELAHQLTDNVFDTVGLRGRQTIATESVEYNEGELTSGVDIHLTPFKSKMRKSDGFCANNRAQGRCRVCQVKSTNTCSECAKDASLGDKVPFICHTCWLCRPTDQDSNVESKECLAFFRMLVF
jgi:hypothetical protein